MRAERMAAGGDALARERSGRIVFAGGALPGELVRVAVTAEKRDFLRGHVVEVIEPSDDRVQPPCAFVAQGCGGCGWQHATVAAQARMKADIVRDALRRTAHLPDAVVEAGPALPSERFRTSLRMAVDRRGSLGYRRARQPHVTHHLGEEGMGDEAVVDRDDVVAAGAAVAERAASIDRHP